MKQKYAVTDKKGNLLKIGYFSEPEVRMAAKAGMRIFELSSKRNASMEITEELTGLFDKKPINKSKKAD